MEEKENKRDMAFNSPRNPPYQLAEKILPILVKEGLSYDDTCYEDLKNALIIAQDLLDELTYPSFR